jgi:ATP-dependent RNA helicase DDX23/PRP28
VDVPPPPPTDTLPPPPPPEDGLGPELVKTKKKGWPSTASKKQPPSIEDILRLKKEKEVAAAKVRILTAPHYHLLRHVHIITAWWDNY